MITPVILAGGSGTRLWPLSRDDHPKQLLSLVGSQTMLQETLLRLADIADISAPIVVANAAHRFMVAEQLRQIGVNSGKILLEPVGRNTAPAVTMAALEALSCQSDPILLVLPADHHIQDTNRFHSAIKMGAGLCRKDHLITFGIVPSKAETGYGYIQKGSPLTDDSSSISARHKNSPAPPVKIKAFVEKPNLKTAKTYIASGNYCWNSGMFMFKASRIIKEIKRHALPIHVACQRAFDNGKRDLDFFRIDQVAFENCPSDSIDYAVMEKTDSGAMIPFDAGWSDLGSWEALWQIGKKNRQENVLKGNVHARGVERSYLHSTGRLIAAVGLKDYIVVETADAILVSPRSRVQEVKQIVDQLKKDARPEARQHCVSINPESSRE